MHGHEEFSKDEERPKMWRGQRCGEVKGRDGLVGGGVQSLYFSQRKMSSM